MATYSGSHTLIQPGSGRVIASAFHPINPQQSGIRHSGSLNPASMHQNQRTASNQNVSNILSRDRSLDNLGFAAAAPVYHVAGVAANFERQRPASARGFEYSGSEHGRPGRPVHHEVHYYSPRAVSLERGGHGAAAAVHPVQQHLHSTGGVLYQQPDGMSYQAHPTLTPSGDLLRLQHREFELNKDKLNAVSMHNSKTLWSSVEMKRAEASQRKDESGKSTALQMEKHQELEAAMTDLGSMRKEYEQLCGETRQSHNIHSLADSKDCRLNSIENEIHALEYDLGRFRDDGMITPATMSSSGVDDFDKVVQSLKSNERILKNKMESLFVEVSKRDNEVFTLRTRLETCQKQQQDQSHHINVLKEQLKAREHKVAMLATDVEELRKRLKEKELLLEKKNKSMLTLQHEKRHTDAQVSEFQEHLDIKERKVCVLQRKVDNLEELLSDKESQLNNARLRLEGLANEQNTFEGVRTSLEEMVKEKDRHMERFKEAKLRLEQENDKQLQVLKKINGELKAKVEDVQTELDEKQSLLVKCREELSDVKGDKFRLEGELQVNQVNLSNKMNELSAVQLELQMLKTKVGAGGVEMKCNSTRMKELESQVSHYMESAMKSQSELDRYMLLVRQAEATSSSKDEQIAQLEEKLNDMESQLSTLKRASQSDRKKTAQILHEARKREEDYSEDSSYIRRALDEKDLRIHELEMAIKETVKMSTEREIMVSGREDLLKQMENQIVEQRQLVDQFARERIQTELRHEATAKELKLKEEQLRAMETECFQSYIPELEKLGRTNHDLSRLIKELLRIIQDKEQYLNDQDRRFLAQQQQQNFSGAGSSWSFDSSSSRAATSGALALDVQGFTRIIHEKDKQLSLVNEDLLQMRIKAADSENQLKNMERLLDDRQRYMGASAQFLPLGLNDAILQPSPLQSHHLLQQKVSQSCSDASSVFSSFLQAQQQCATEISTLRQANDELTLRLTQIKCNLDEKDDRIRVMEKEVLINRDLSSETEILRKTNSDLNSTVIDKDTQISILNKDIERFKSEKNELHRNLNSAQGEIRDRCEKLRVFESTVNSQQDEISNLRQQAASLETDLKMQKDEVQFREERLQQCKIAQAEESARLRKAISEGQDRIVQIKTQLEEQETAFQLLSTKHEALRGEMDGVKRRNIEYENKISRQKVNLSDYEDKIKTLETECYHVLADEIDRLKRSNEEMTARIQQLNKRSEEREHRLRKVEQENKDLLDEIHTLRKKNYELESSLDYTKSVLIDHPHSAAGATAKHEVQGSGNAHTSRSTSSMDGGYASHSSSHGDPAFLDSTSAAFIEQKLQHARCEIERCEEENLDLRNSLQEVLLNCDDLKSQLNAAQFETQQLRQKLSVPDGATKTLTKELNNAQFQVVQLSKELSESQALQKQYADQCKTFQSDQEKVTRKCAQIEKQSQVHEERAVVLGKEIDSKNAQLEQLGCEIEKWVRKSQELEERVLRLTTQLETVQTAMVEQCGGIQGETEHLRKVLAEKDRELNDLSTRFKTREDQMQKAESQMESVIMEFQQRLEVSQKNHSSHKEELVLRDKQLSEVREELENRVRELAHLKANVSDQQDRKLQELSEEVVKRDQALTELSDVLSIKDMNIIELQEALQDMQRDQQAAAGQNSQQLEKIKQMQTALEKEAQLNQRSQQANKELQEELHKCQRALTDLNDELDSKERRVHDLESVVERRSSRRGSRERDPRDDRNSPQATERRLLEKNKELFDELEKCNRALRQVVDELDGKDRCIQELEMKLAQSADLESGDKLHLSSRVEELEEELAVSSNELKERDYKLASALTEINNLGHEIQMLHHHQQQQQHRQEEQDQSQDSAALQESRLQLDGLQVELLARDAELARLEQMCNEHHLKKLESLEEERKCMISALEEQQRTIEHYHGQLQSATDNVDFERLRSEHAQCVELQARLKSELEQRERQATILEEQLEKQMAEVLVVKEEALMAAICEKDANIALMEIQGVRSAQHNSAINKLCDEKMRLHQQLQQLTQTRMKLQESLGATTPAESAPQNATRRTQPR